MPTKQPVTRLQDQRDEQKHRDRTRISQLATHLGNMRRVSAAPKTCCSPLGSDAAAHSTMIHASATATVAAEAATAAAV
jgi:hypothetical protein